VTVAGLVLAAGAGRRFGGPKALVELDGERLVNRAVRVLGEGGLTTRYVVQGAADLTGLSGAEVVDNPDWAEGVGLSLLASLPVVLGFGLVAATGIGALVIGAGILSMMAVAAGIGVFRGKPDHRDGCRVVRRRSA